MAKPSSSLWNWGTYLVKVTVTASLLGWVFRQFDLAESLDLLQAIPPAVILLAFALTLLVIGMGAFRWQLLLRSVQIHLPLRAIYTISFISNFFNSLLGDADETCWHLPGFRDQPRPPGDTRCPTVGSGLPEWA